MSTFYTPIYTYGTYYILLAVCMSPMFFPQGSHRGRQGPGLYQFSDMQSAAAIGINGLDAQGFQGWMSWKIPSFEMDGEQGYPSSWMGWMSWKIPSTNG